MLRTVDATQALAALTEISSQIIEAVIVDGDGSVLASTTADTDLARQFAEGVARLLTEAELVREPRGLANVTQLEAATLGGSVFVVRRGARLIAATTRPDPTVGLVFYDLKHCLRSIEEPEPEPKPPPARRKKADASS